MSYLQKFTEFLSTVPLNVYRDRYRPIKIVEMDLPKNIQALWLLYRCYWDEHNFLSFDDFYSLYLNEKKNELEEFRTKIMMCEKCFYLWLPARIYRTWASIVTQIHWWYVAEDVFWSWSIEMSEELDHAWADFRINYKSRIINIQVKKITKSREVRREKTTKNKIEWDFINIEYFVPNYDIIINNKKKNWELRKWYVDFKEQYLDNKYLAILNNWFVIFQQWLFSWIKQEYDS